MIQLFSTQLINEYKSGNYFGCEMTGQSEEQQYEMQQRWLNVMARKGWIINESIIDNDNIDNYERDGENALVEVLS